MLYECYNRSVHLEVQQQSTDVGHGSNSDYMVLRTRLRFTKVAQETTSGAAGVVPWKV